ncbi:amino acid ABC transporter permease [Aeromicrobium senzhongii]|uniref:Amino acid ABC transporter permease n=1 Tax=Aeromicrobium senzhongii TaxID=2663859 RepID=A0ABX6SRR8_9ACTN|nr:amino acid ABC transporter permease [Aeromicrobium senzhongii]QNL93716.1 amino acid ABC transporter permease [Aeromicrobium senzhongii]
MNADWGLIVSTVLEGVGVTVLLTVVSMALALVLGFPVALMRVSRIAPLRWVGTSYVEVVRGVPVIAWMLLLFYGLANLTGSEPIPTAIIALTLVATAYVAENYRAALLSVPVGQWEAAQALGLKRSQLFWRIIAPQGIAVAMAPCATYAIGLLKESAFASVIGVSDVSFQALNLANGGQPALAAFLVAGAVYLVLSLPIAASSRWLDATLRRRSAA